ncbi:putative short-chain dehydrogenase [Thelonectria olida]|uniref:Short-chain dehydrogenase n=1 Tax=Thelonectria olida TaxID=1576542 RepID=A0A9P8VQ31_9HYPO|nr:putative short-chain dehydrogenase [Thelonectria olida]
MAPPSLKYVNKLRGKRILIFGATSGFGFAVAEAAIEHGATVTLSGSKPERLTHAVERLKISYGDIIRGDQIKTVACDLGDLDNLTSHLTELFNTVTDSGKNKLDHIVFTAGDAHRGPAKVLAGTEYLSNSPDASLTFTNGVSGHKPVKGWAVPAMAATALEGLVRGLAVDLAPVRVNLVSAGPVSTEVLASLPKEYVHMYAKETLVKRISRPEDIAEAYIYIMKDGGITGTVLFSDGGRRLA